ncbi:hypothetical protein H310_13088 [Aphanomyces invadans]|uniref:Transmembrane protein n=1 Tax=Aphanomyces invadans TaxID=157072 RepID=A0A024TH06_9STRA|nr:hypothetical protein H310_13088 [Aphanomyces invadans]ETV92642.1 hypothetical protein H310_13088 [Aphanomyces invadans]|eukprot:XP_008878678.1 hypothetical protein H310_13088 [Aphanomyces invadans]
MLPTAASTTASCITEDERVFVPQSVYGGYDPNRYSAHVAIPRRRRRPNPSSCTAFLTLTPRTTLQLVWFQVLHAAFVTVAFVAAWFIAAVCMLLATLSTVCTPSMPPWLCWTIVLVANIDIHLYNSISRQGEHIFVTLSTARDFGAMVLYFAFVKPFVAVVTTGAPLYALVMSIRWTVALAITSFTSSSATVAQFAPSTCWPFLYVVIQVGCVYLTMCLCQALAKGTCHATRYICCDHLAIYGYVYGMPIPMACRTPSHMMGVFGAGRIV